MIFYTPATEHLAKNIALPEGRCTIKHFTDDELFVRLDETVKNKNVWVVAGTQPPAEHLLELFFLLDTLQRAGAKINLLITYFAYARQIVATQGEAQSPQVICTFLKNFDIKTIKIIHPHSLLLHDFLPFTALIDFDFFCKLAQEYDAIAAPDKGAHVFAQKIAQKSKKSLIQVQKIRPEKEEVEIVGVTGNIAGKKVLLVDDIIATGRTMLAAAEYLKKAGATSVAAAATHGVFSADSRQNLQKSILEKIFVTNTLDHASEGKITVVDSASFIQKNIQNN